MYLASNKVSKNKDLVIKVQNPLDEDALLDFKKEVNNPNAFCKTQYRPKSTQCLVLLWKKDRDTVGYIVAGKMDGDLLSLLELNPYTTYEFLKM